MARFVSDFAYDEDENTSFSSLLDGIVKHGLKISFKKGSAGWPVVEVEGDRKALEDWVETFYGDEGIDLIED